MTSLKAMCHDLASIFGTTPAFMYECQRDLVRKRILVPRPGRGPGSGVPATASTVAKLVIAYALAGGPPDPFADDGLECMLKGLLPIRQVTVMQSGTGAGLEIRATIRPVVIKKIRKMLESTT